MDDEGVVQPQGLPRTMPPSTRSSTFPWKSSKPSRGNAAPRPQDSEDSMDLDDADHSVITMATSYPSPVSPPTIDIGHPSCPSSGRRARDEPAQTRRHLECGDASISSSKSSSREQLGNDFERAGKRPKSSAAAAASPLATMAGPLADVERAKANEAASANGAMRNRWKKARLSDQQRSRVRRLVDLFHGLHPLFQSAERAEDHFARSFLNPEFPLLRWELVSLGYVAERCVSYEEMAIDSGKRIVQRYPQVVRKLAREMLDQRTPRPAVSGHAEGDDGREKDKGKARRKKSDGKKRRKRGWRKDRRVVATGKELRSVGPKPAARTTAAAMATPKKATSSSITGESADSMQEDESKAPDGVFSDDDLDAYSSASSDSDADATSGGRGGNTRDDGGGADTTDVDMGKRFILLPVKSVGPDGMVKWKTVETFERIEEPGAEADVGSGEDDRMDIDTMGGDGTYASGRTLRRGRRWDLKTPPFMKDMGVAAAADSKLFSPSTGGDPNTPRRRDGARPPSSSSNLCRVLRMETRCVLVDRSAVDADPVLEILCDHGEIFAELWAGFKAEDVRESAERIHRVLESLTVPPKVEVFGALLPAKKQARAATKPSRAANAKTAAAVDSAIAIEATDSVSDDADEARPLTSTVTAAAVLQAPVFGTSRQKRAILSRYLRFAFGNPKFIHTTPHETRRAEERSAMEGASGPGARREEMERRLATLVFNGGPAGGERRGVGGVSGAPDEGGEDPALMISFVIWMCIMRVHGERLDEEEWREWKMLEEDKMVTQ
ncbi:hypothetical protein HDU96_002555 [Phlyctochytrium bullatum]|nr:hypothetical protein HDU96_002555 [Phlyctochytrium bullatum]